VPPTSSSSSSTRPITLGDIKLQLAHFSQIVRRIVFGKSLGIQITDDTVVVGVVSRGLISPRVRDTLKATYSQSTVAQVIRELVDRAQALYGPAYSVVGGVPGERCFFEARPLADSLPEDHVERTRAIEALMPPVLGTGFALAQGTVAVVNECPVLLLWASPRTKLMRDLLTFSKVGVVVDRIEPTPLAALRHSFQFTPPPAGEAPQIRLLVGPQMGVGFLVQGRVCLAWRRIQAKKDAQWESSMMQAVRAFEETRRQLALGSISQILVQGLNDNEEDTARTRQLASSCGLLVSMVPGPPFDGEFIAAGLALGGFEDDEDPGIRVPNLAAQVQGAPDWFKIIRVGEIGILSCLIVLFALVLNFRLRDAKFRVSTVKATEAKWFKSENPAQLSKRREKEFSILSQQVSFLDTQGLFVHEVIEAVCKSLPAEARLLNLSFDMDDSLGSNGRRVNLRIEAPDELQMVTTLRSAPALRPYFSQWQLTSLKKEAGGNTPFNIVAKGSGPVVIPKEQVDPPKGGKKP